MTFRVALVATLLGSALSPSPSAAQSAGCSGSLSGAVKATFTCTVTLTRAGQGKTLSFVIAPIGAIAGVRSLEPVAFQIAEPPSVQTYRLESLGSGGCTLRTSGGKVFSATPSKGKGEAELNLDTVERERSASGSYTVSGTLRARLVATGDGAGEVVNLDVAF